ncbi:hypothetical protein SNOG_11361 [Parastagonospora nodorum SN15]|uniref:Uncharacterized protein n=1 Tax=Phaeosphaeria nodorum (strain SN15 / ATCC MYA-4574 / FGSC 10173) TaxID=321614 RepID=Q0UA53_PHANO|nr:hypothetical protein SNOG_11361 [Parastagonospora nodorum SN15]EAT81069.1 hypothetical protein SNOG_11361 [Parastagonospora nodorum SN15]
MGRMPLFAENEACYPTWTIRIEIGLAHCPNLIATKDETEYFSSEGLQLIQQSLAELGLIPRKAGFRLTMVLDDDIMYSQTEEVLKAMRLSYEKSTQAGMHFRVYGYPASDGAPIVRIDRYYRLHAELWQDFAGSQRCRKDHPAEYPSDDDAPDQASWLNRSANEMERRGHSMDELPEYEMKMEWISLLRDRAY